MGTSKEVRGIAYGTVIQLVYRRALWSASETSQEPNVRDLSTRQERFQQSGASG